MLVGAFLVLSVLLLFLPSSYKIIIKNSRYYGYCSPFSDGQNPCKTIDPPQIVTKQEPYIKAWWHTTQISREFTKREVSTEWIKSGSILTGKTTTGILAITFFLLQMAVVIGAVYLFLVTLIKALRLSGSEKIAWVCLILFLFPIGSIIFVFVKPQSKTKRPPKNQRS